MRGERTREEEGHNERWWHGKRWTDGDTAGWEVAEVKRQHNNQLGQTRGMRAKGRRLGRVRGDDGVYFSNIFNLSIFIFGPSPSSSISSPSPLAFDAGRRCQHSCCCCRSSLCHHHRCHCPHCCHYAGICVAPTCCPFVALAGCCLLLAFCLCCWHLCRASLFRLIVVFAANCCGDKADDNAVAFAANAATPTIAVVINATAVSVAVVAATTIAATAAATATAVLLLAFLPLLL
jgi:hypothetical protein